MKNHHEVGHFKNRMMIVLLSLFVLVVTAGQSFAATTCSTCHGMPPLDSADGSRIPSTGAFKGSHQVHVSGAPAPASACVDCHSAAASYAMSHSATTGKNVINLTDNIYSKGAFFNQTSMPVMGTCSNVSCHSNVYAEETITTPVWGSTGNGCSACHTTPIGTNGPETGNHTNVDSHKVACINCHEADTTSTTKPSVGHADGNIDIANVGYATLNKAKGTPGATCSTASCHANVYGAGSVVTPNWGTTGNGCSACHSVAIGDNGPATGAHNAHAGKSCTLCHAAGTTSTSAPTKGNGHVDGNIDINFSLGYPIDVPKHVAGTYTNTCSTTYCHSNGKGSFVATNWGGSSNGCRFCHPALSVGHNPHLADLFDAGTPVNFYGYTSIKSTGGDYKFGCSICHPTTIASHMNNTVEVDLTASAAGGHLKANNGASAAMNGAKQCLNVYCHSNGYSANVQYATTPAWGGSFPDDKCSNCHGNSPGVNIAGSTAHSAHVVGIHYEDIFNGISKKLPRGGGDTVNAAHGRNNRSTTINCNICHSSTVSSFFNDKNSVCKDCHGGVAPLKGNASIADTSKHVNGSVDVNFINSTIATKAQVAQAAFAAYTAAGSGGWSRNKSIYKSYTSGYDVTKVALSASPAYSAAGCAVACHGNNAVLWTDTVTCTSCHTRLK